jgi:hypothetical protein
MHLISGTEKDHKHIYKLGTIFFVDEQLQTQCKTNSAYTESVLQLTHLLGFRLQIYAAGIMVLSF